ncbi:hypothetical protein K469DRAFT_699359 [Zopfia rhizophila CBS 207.26]|uniref:Uncharacterized protein n=1 Tax=Zopfia rhizophila CBS 207.26 TaxID=1314779 RepID=A0A6A6EUD1_9PEZI|nr:hypothetical protein K469DRAFT_699359 [Zopfia rhizophila CBS 207.26]
MTAVGFSVEKLHSSAWQFNPAKLDVERGIQFHNPHPDKNISFLLARRFGQGLTRAYGWIGAMFKYV